MIPGEYLLGEGDIVANEGRATVELVVANTGDRPIQVGSHFHFFEVNRALRFDRAKAFGMRLNVPAGTAVRFEPGDEKRVTLVEIAGAKRVFGLNALSEGGDRDAALRKLQSEYVDRGLLVIGIYHPKPPGNWDINRVESAAKEKQFSFPVALDGDWTALKRWWLTQDRDFTSVSFLLDRTGIVRYVHPGGEFHEGTLGALTNHESCHRDFHTIETEIVRLLAE